MTALRFLRGRSSRASSSKPIPLILLSTQGQEGPIDGPKPCSHMRAIASLWSPLSRQNDGNPYRFNGPLLPPHTSAFAWFLRCQLCIGADTPITLVISSEPAHSHMLDTVRQSEYHNSPLGPSSAISWCCLVLSVRIASLPRWD
jgi:hypothetical protein